MLGLVVSHSRMGCPCSRNLDLFQFQISKPAFGVKKHEQGGRLLVFQVTTGLMFSTGEPSNGSFRPFRRVCRTNESKGKFKVSSG